MYILKELDLKFCCIVVGDVEKCITFLFCFI